MAGEFKAAIVEGNESPTSRHEGEAMRGRKPASPSKSDRAPRETLPLSSITRDPELSFRVGGIKEKLVTEYADAMRAGSKFPAVVVFRDSEGKLWLADGFHRCAAAELAGADAVLAEVREGGDRRAALLFAAGANAGHGLRRTNVEKRKCVQALLADEEWRAWSDREIASRCGVHHELVGTLRKQLADSASSSPRRGKDGKTRKAPKATKRPKPNPAKAVAALTRELDQTARRYVKRWPRELVLDAAKKWLENLSQG